MLLCNKIHTPEEVEADRVADLVRVMTQSFFKYDGRRAGPGRFAVGEWNYGGGGYEWCSYEHLQKAAQDFEDDLNEKGWKVTVRAPKWWWRVGMPTIVVEARVEASHDH